MYYNRAKFGAGSFNRFQVMNFWKFQKIFGEKVGGVEEMFLNNFLSLHSIFLKFGTEFQDYH